MYGKDGIYETGAPYQIICHTCKNHTQKGNYEEVVAEWNNQICNK